MKQDAILDSVEKTSKEWLGAVKANTQSAFDLTEKAFTVRDAEGVRQFWADSFKATREGVERLVKVGQDAMSEQSAAIKKATK